MTEERTFPNAAASIPSARRFTVDTLAGVSKDITDSVAVMVSELATNSVRHAATEFTISIDRDADMVRVAVTDAGDKLPTVRSPAPTDHSGRGLQIVSALADEWGVTEMVGRPGKTVWFVIATPSSDSDPAVADSAKRPGEVPQPPAEPRARSRAEHPRSGRRADPPTRCHRARPVEAGRRSAS